MAMVFNRFLGENRAREPGQLPAGHCTISRNQKPGRGDLRAWRQPLEVMTVPAVPQRKTIYRMGRDLARDDAYWLSWPSIVHAVRGFDVEDPTERTFYTGDGYPKVTDNLALSNSAPSPNPVAHRPLGVPAPTSAMTVTVTPSSEDSDEEPSAYFYVYTFVNDWGWESGPSPVSARVDKRSIDGATLASFAAAPSGGFSINRIRIYRTQSSSTGADFFFLREVPSSTSSTTDDLRAVGELIPTTGWLPAPGIQRGGADNYTEPNLSNLTTMWNGMLAGIVGRSVRVCEAYIPYSWPDAYDVVPPDGTPVAIGVFGQSMVVLTTSRPLLVTGSSPEGLDQVPIEMPQGCVSAQSVVSMGSGVAWASNDGLCWYGAGGAKILTAGLMLRDDWLALRPHTIIGQMYEGLYFGSYEPAAGQPRRGFMLDPSGGSGIFFQDEGFDAAHFDELQDQLYLLRGNRILRWEGGSSFETCASRSGVVRAERPVNWAVAKLVASAFPAQLTIWADGVMVFDAAIQDRSPFRLPGGFMATDWQLQISLAGGASEPAAQGVVLAISTDDLRSAST